MQRAELATAVRTALETCCPNSSTSLLGSLADGTADAYSDIDVQWVVPDDEFPACLDRGLAALAEVYPVESVRPDPDLLHSDRRRLLFVQFADVPLFWRLDLAVCATSVAGNPRYDVDNPAARAADDEWSRPASALANAIGAVKAVVRQRHEHARGLLERGFERIGVADGATGVWNDDVRRLADAAASQDQTLSGLAACVRALADRELT
jgi:predicted nucleotidyltransferase